MISQKELKELLHYNSVTGIFTWTNKARKNRGKVAGSLSNKTNYIRICVLGKYYYAHRLAYVYVYGGINNETIDHIDGNTTNNSISNLRCVSQSDNKKNAKKSKANKSGIVGVHWCSANKKWIAKVTHKRKEIVLLKTIDKFEAICARKSGENKYGFHQNHGR